MSADDLTQFIDENLSSTPAKKLLEVVSDAFAFIRSTETNQAFSTVTLEQLINDQIARNGESDTSNAAQFDVFSYTPSDTPPAGEEATERANFVGGSDTNRPTKLDRVNALVNEINAVAAEIQALEPTDVASTSEYALAGEIAAPEDIA